MSFENKIITEKYIIKLNELSYSSNNNYIKTKFKLIVKYMLCDSMLNNIPISDECFIQIDETNEVPFVIKTDLYSELSELDTLNQGNLLDTIKKLKSDYAKELKDEKTLRSVLNEGNIIERNQEMLNNFIKEFGYDPFQRSILNHPNHNKNNNDGIDINLSDVESDEEDTKKEHPQNTNNIKESNNNQKNNLVNDKGIQELKDELQNKIDQVQQNGSLESLNQIMDIIKINFNDICNDIEVSEVSHFNKYMNNNNNPDNNPDNNADNADNVNNANNETNNDTNNDDNVDKDNKKNDSDGKAKTVKKRLTKKEKEKLEREKILAEAQAKEAENNALTKLEKNKKIIESLINNANELQKDKTSLSSVVLKDAIKAVLTIADYYQNGFILIKSGVKANMLYIYLIKYFNEPDAMFNLGENLINGISIMKNHNQGAKLIKVAAEKFKHTKSIAKMKILTRLSKK